MLDSTKDAVRLDVGDPVRRTYLINVPSVADRARWRRACAASGARRHGPLAQLECLKAGVTALMPAESELQQRTRDAVLGLIARHEGNLRAQNEALLADAPAETVTPLLQATVASGEALELVDSAVREGYPRYAMMRADDASYAQLSGIEAARLFVADWQGLGAPCARNTAGLTEAALAEIPEFDLSLIGARVEQLCSVTPSQRKNSDLPSPVSSAGKTSNLSETTTSRPKAGSRSRNSTSN